MQGNRWHSPRIRWYPDVMSPGVRWLVRLPCGSEMAEQRLTQAWVRLGRPSLGYKRPVGLSLAEGSDGP
jgi:hypothetical protein